MQAVVLLVVIVGAWLVETLAVGLNWQLAVGLNWQASQ